MFHLYGYALRARTCKEVTHLLKCLLPSLSLMIYVCARIGLELLFSNWWLHEFILMYKSCVHVFRVKSSSIFNTNTNTNSLYLELCGVIFALNVNRSYWNIQRSVKAKYTTTN